METCPLEKMVDLLVAMRNDFKELNDRKLLNSGLPRVIISDPSTTIDMRNDSQPKMALKSRNIKLSGKPNVSADINANVYSKFSSAKCVGKSQQPPTCLNRPGVKNAQVGTSISKKDENKSNLTSNGKKMSLPTAGEKLRSSFRKLISLKDEPKPSFSGPEKPTIRIVSTLKKESVDQNSEQGQLKRRSVGSSQVTRTSSLRSSLSGIATKPQTTTKIMSQSIESAERKTLVRRSTSSSLIGLSSTLTSSRPRAASAVLTKSRLPATSNLKTSLPNTRSSLSKLSLTSTGNLAEKFPDQNECQSRHRLGNESLLKKAIGKAASTLTLSDSMQHKLSSLKVSTSTKSLMSRTDDLTSEKGATKLIRSSSLRISPKPSTITLTPLLKAAVKPSVQPELKKVTASTASESLRGTLRSTYTRFQRTPLTLVQSASESSKKKPRVSGIPSTTGQGPTNANKVPSTKAPLTKSKTVSGR